MAIIYLSPHLSVDSTGATQVAKNNLKMLQTLFGCEVMPYAVNRNPILEATPLDVTRSTAGTAFANLQGLCATLSAKGRKQFLDDIKSKSPRLIWLDSSLFGRLISEIRLIAPSAKIVSYFHNSEIDLVKHRLLNGALHYIPAWMATYSNELNSAKRADAVATITKCDGMRINRLYGRNNAYTLPVSLSLKEGIHSRWMNSNEVLFVGSDFLPNIEGLRFLNNKVAPLLSKKRILVAGRGLARHLEGKVNDRIELIGFVEDLSDLYMKSRATLAPIFSGGGMKVKIAESLMHNRPVIATPFAAIGYEDSGSDSIHKVDSAEKFANAIEEWEPEFKDSAVTDFRNLYSFDANLKCVIGMLKDIGVKV